MFENSVAINDEAFISPQKRPSIQLTEDSTASAIRSKMVTVIQAWNE